MSVFTALYRLLLGPLELFFDVLYSLSYRFLGNQGLAIVVLSLGMNFLVLPLYRRADALQAEERDLEQSLQPWVKHIKKTFSGNERFMMLQAYYRQKGYKPAYALKGSLSLLLEVPFFIAAYRFLSGLTLLDGVSFGPIRDLGAPDGMLTLGGIPVNVLPILMTAINLVSGYIYTRGMPAKSKIQLYGMALIFLALLYRSPAGLVFYWTLNNVFSLVKNIFYKLKRPGFVLCCLFSAVGAALLVRVLIRPLDMPSHQTWALVLLPLLQIPMILYWLLRKRGLREAPAVTRREKTIFLLGCLFLTLLTGALIPSGVIRSSPEEFIDIYYYRSPLLYVLSSLLLAAGTFLIWLGVFYALASPSGKRIMSFAVWAVCGCAVINYMCFAVDLGTLSPLLQYDDPLHFSISLRLLNLLVMAAAAAVLYLVWKKWGSLTQTVLLAAGIAALVMSVVNLVHIQAGALELKARIQSSSSGLDNEDIPSIPLSTDGHNVIVIMLDRAISGYLPYLFQEKPELREQFDGFVYYPNTVSFGGYTNVGSPGIYGGYEYTPLEMNRRSDELLADKHNEALKVMPVLFDRAGYRITLCDPTYAGYQWVPDLSAFDDYPQFRTFITNGRYIEDPEASAARVNEQLDRNFFCYSMVKVLPLAFQGLLYSDGLYSHSNALVDKPVQTRTGLSQAAGFKQSFMNSYTALQALPSITVIENGARDNYIVFTNDTTHDPMMLQEPDYVPAETVDNREYDAAHPAREDDQGRILPLGTQKQVIHYQSNMAAMLLLGQWLDMLRENGVYDNTRIILVSDHGRELDFQLDSLSFYDQKLDGMLYNALLLVKDFDSRGAVRTDDSFMTNADVPVLAMQGLISDPVNPFTGKPISSDPKNASELYILATDDWDILINNGTTFLPAPWISVRDDIFVEENWKLDAEPPAG